MRKVFTYSKKKPYSSLKASESFAAATESLQQKENAQANAQSTRLADPAGDTPQTKRRKDIHTLFSKIDRQLNFLSLNEQADFSKYYRHKNIILNDHLTTGVSCSLDELLALLQQTDAMCFDDWFALQTPSMSASPNKPVSVSKLGEATFSEVFQFRCNDSDSDRVVKIIPLAMDAADLLETDVYPLPIGIDAAMHECTVLRKISALKEHRTTATPICWTGFNQILDMKVVKGHYPAELVSIWSAWDESNESENGSPERYGESQCFLTITMENGGVDLESFPLKNMHQARSIVCQLVTALALAEDKLEFEHRDLHLGNVLVKETSVASFLPSESAESEFEFSGVKCSIIDYSLARMRDRDRVIFRDLDAIEWLFQGDASIDSQYQVYKDMRNAKGAASWKEFNPKSNIIWLGFILERLVEGQKKTVARPKGLFQQLMALKDRLPDYLSASELKRNDPFFLQNRRAPLTE